MDSFSAHGDQREMTEFLGNQTKSIKKLFLVHGDIDVQENFSKHLRSNGFTDIAIPALKEEIQVN